METQRKLIAYWMKTNNHIRHCLAIPNLRHADKTFKACSSKMIRAQLGKLTANVLSSGIEAIVDSPFPELSPAMLSMASDSQVLLTTRDADDWVTKRKHYHGGSAMVCHESLWPMMNKTSPFDYFRCLEISHNIAVHIVGGVAIGHIGKLVDTVENLEEFQEYDVQLNAGGSIIKVPGVLLDSKAQIVRVNSIPDTSLKQAYLAYEAYVMRSVPENRLLVFNFFSKEYGGDKLASNKAMSNLLQRKFGV